MQAAMRRFLAHLRFTRASAENTVSAYRTDLQQFAARARALGVYGPGELTEQVLQAFRDWLGDQEFRPSTVSRKVAAVRAFLGYLREVEGRSVPEIGEALRPPRAPKAAPLILSQTEVARLLAAPMVRANARGLRDAALLAMLYATGVRATEVVGLTMADVDLQHSMVHVSGSEPRSLPLGLAAGPLKRYLDEGRPQLVKQPRETALFLNPRGRALSRQGLWLVVKRWAEAAGLGSDVSPHTLRHSLAHHLLEEGRSRREVQRLLGLSSPNSIRSHRRER